MMKKLLALVLALCVVFSFAATAFAAGKPKITKQPETSTTSKNGKVSFSVKVSGTVNSITWHFIDPATGEDYTGKTLPKSVKGVKVSNPNSKKITLSKVPESMHGWTVYCHINGNAYKVDSDRVMLLVYGLEPPADPSAAENPEPAPEEPAPETPETPSEPEQPDQPDEPAPETPETPETPSEPEQPEQPDEPAPETPETPDTPAEPEKPQEPEQPQEPEEPENPDAIEYAGGELANNTIVITSSSNILRMLDAAGNLTEGEPSSRLEFLNTGSFLVVSDELIKSWTINGVNYEPSEPVKEFKVLDVTSDMSVEVKLSRTTAANAKVDENRMCKVKCTGCTFTYLSAGLRGATEGEVPSGAPVRIMADSPALAANGYSFNGAAPENQGLTSFQFIVNEDVEIIAK